MTRHNLIVMLCSFIMQLSSLSSFAEQNSTISPIKFGLTPALLNYQHSLNKMWISYMEERLHQQVKFVQRDTYRENMDLIKQQSLDFAWVCSYPYIQLQKSVQIVAVPVYRGKSLYRSYLIVPSSDRRTRSIGDLENKIFAYADPDSNTGYLVPRFELKKLGVDIDHFFKKTFFTWAHKAIIEAVADQVADGGAVDSYIWDALNTLNPQLTSKTRIVSKSVEFGFPPIVANNNIGKQNLQAMRHVLLNMENDEKGRLILKRLNLDGFIIGSEDMYENISAMAHSFKR